MISRQRRQAGRPEIGLVVDRVGDPDGCRATIGSLMDEYERYVEIQHAICPACPVVRAGPVIVRSMFEWKARRDGRLAHWTVADIRAYLLDEVPLFEDRGLRRDAPTCAKDLVYFMSDRGTLAGDRVRALTDATDDVLMSATNTRGAGEEGGARSAKRKAAQAARRQNRR